MTASYSLVLRSCPDAARDAVSQVLGRAFSLKDTTSASISQSTPIVILTGLALDEAAVLNLVLQPLISAGAVVEFSNEELVDLPKVDWPRRPSVFKRDISEHLADCQIVLPCPQCQQSHKLADLLVAKLISGATAHPQPRGAQEFKGAALPEITPFSNPVLSSGGPGGGNGAAPAAAADGGGDDAFSRLNELFPDDNAGFMPNDEAITNLLDRLLPDEDGNPIGSVSGLQRAVNPSSKRLAAVGSGGYAVFLAKITDEGRRAKAVPLIAELAKIPPADADALSKKPIIPVLKGVSKEEAESAKQKFAKIGILARVKAPE
jgi:hypothetical protein